MFRQEKDEKHACTMITVTRKCRTSYDCFAKYHALENYEN